MQNKNGPANNINPADDILKRLLFLENQIKRMDAIEIYLKQATQPGKQIGQMNAREVIREQNRDGLEANLQAQINQAIQNELEPLKRSLYELSVRIYKMENRITELEKGKESTPAESKPSIIYQEFVVDKLFVDKFEQITNLGQVGIRELSGHLNIGTTLESEAVPQELISDLKEEEEKLKGLKEKLKGSMEKPEAGGGE